MTNTWIGRDILRGAGGRARRGPQWEYERVSEVPCFFCEGQGSAGSCSGEIKGDDMKVFVAGASGAIGQPLIAELIRKGHTVTGMTQSETGGNRLHAYGAEAAVANAFDEAAVEAALRASGAKIVIDELTSLPKTPSELPAHAARDRKLRIEGGGNLHRAALTCGVRRYIQQSSGFFLEAKGVLADESSPLAINASPFVASSAQMYAYLEQRVLESSMEGTLLRYGFFYGPNTWYHPKGGAADEVRKQLFPVIQGARRSGRSFILKTRHMQRWPLSQRLRGNMWLWTMIRCR
jgi:nucleoside-diphosphate-sugar epimerase